VVDIVLKFMKDLVTSCSILIENALIVKMFSFLRVQYMIRNLFILRMNFMQKNLHIIIKDLMTQK